MGRKKIEIDWIQFDKLCTIHCTLSEIAGWFDCSEDTIERRVKERHEENADDYPDATFAEYYKKHEGKGKASLRRKQWEIALAGNTTMNIWLGKQYLGQSDKNFEKQDQTLVIKHEYGKKEK